MHEETGLDVTGVRFRGVIHVDVNTANGIMVFVFTAEATSRDFRNSAEGTLEWVALDQTDALPLVEDLPVLLPLLFGGLDGEPASEFPFFAHSSYDQSDQQVLIFAEPSSATHSTGQPSQ